MFGENLQHKSINTFLPGAQSESAWAETCSLYWHLLDLGWNCKWCSCWAFRMQIAAAIWSSSADPKHETTNRQMCHSLNGGPTGALMSLCSWDVCVSVNLTVGPNESFGLIRGWCGGRWGSWLSAPVYLPHRVSQGKSTGARGGEENTGGARREKTETKAAAMLTWTGWRIRQTFGSSPYLWDRWPTGFTSNATFSDCFHSTGQHANGTRYYRLSQRRVLVALLLLLSFFTKTKHL